LENEKFRIDYNYTTIFDKDRNYRTDWSKKINSFVFNYNSNGDIAHYKSSGEMVLLRKLSEIEEGFDDNNEHYQSITVLDSQGNKCILQVFDKTSIGLKIIYSNLRREFANK